MIIMIFTPGCIGEWGAHTIAQCQVAIGQTNTPAVEYGYVNNKTGEGMEILYSNGIKMILNADNDKKYWHGSCGVRYEGEEGWIAVADAYQKPDVSDPRILADFDKIITEYCERTGRPVKAPKNWDDAISPMGHVLDFFDCIRTRRQTIANPEMMHHSMSTIHAANICMWLKRDMKYNPIKQEFLNDVEANRLRTRAQREPWMIG